MRDKRFEIPLKSQFLSKDQKYYMSLKFERKKLNRTQRKLHDIIFEADTRLGKLFDIVLMVVIIASILVVMLESVEQIDARFHVLFYTLEWFFTIFFTLEYATRIYIVKKPFRYITSFFGIIDLLAIIPTYLSLFVAGTQTLLVIRALRLLRVFRIFKLASFLKEGSVIIQALKASRAKMTVFIVFILLSVTIIGSVMYLVEGDQNSGFTSIPRSIYWAIVTLTTVGYGDIAPVTEFGQFLAAIVMLMGYAVIAVPTGIVSAEIVSTHHEQHTTQACPSCMEEGHDTDAIHCKFCGESLND